RYADYVVSSTGRPDEDSVDGLTKIRQFKKQPYPQIMVSVNMLDTGFDFPELLNLVFARYTRSEILYRQMRGRGSRRAPGKGMFTMFDFVGVTDEFEGQDDMVQGGAFSNKPPRRRAPVPRRLLALDIDDHIDPNTRGWLTLDAEGHLVVPAEVERRAQALGTRFEAWLLRHQDEYDAEQRRWLALIGSTTRANAETLDAFTPDHFDFYSAFIALGGQARARMLFGGAQALDELLTDINLAVFSGSGADAPYIAQTNASRTPH
ncbi:MAG TPA: type I restriction-modification enzyme R subunit C-terminal domain-containing protein, partial [Rhodanobacteraceae bacterium]|nr:type I restriction-modification enzyme R subunit C-terminal domain-containing protein [Rhodanobacteraceae bacterium]